MKSLAILKQRNYQYYFSGQLVSLTGSWAQQIAMTWLAYEWTKSSVWVGAFSFASQIPSFLLSSVAGVMSDRYSRRKIFLLAQWAGAAQAIAMTFLYLSGSRDLTLYLILTILLGCITGFELTARFGLVVDLGKRQDWSSAISLNSVIIHGTRMLGPALAGILMYNGLTLWCFLINAISFGPIIFALNKTKVEETKKNKSDLNESFYTSFSKSISYAWNHFRIRKILLVAILLSAVGSAMHVLMPELASVRLQGNARTFSWLNSANAIGAVLGSLSVAVYNGPRRGLRADTMRVLLFLGSLLTVFAVTKTEWIMMASIAAFGFFSMQLWPTLNHAIQSSTDESYRGRVTALWNMTFQGMSPLAALIVGWASDRFGPQMILLIAGSLTFAFMIGIYGHGLIKRRGKISV